MIHMLYLAPSFVAIITPFILYNTLDQDKFCRDFAQQIQSDKISQKDLTLYFTECDGKQCSLLLSSMIYDANSTNLDLLSKTLQTLYLEDVVDEELIFKATVDRVYNHFGIKGYSYSASYAEQKSSPELKHEIIQTIRFLKAFKFKNLSDDQAHRLFTVIYVAFSNEIGLFKLNNGHAQAEDITDDLIHAVQNNYIYFQKEVTYSTKDDFISRFITFLINQTTSKSETPPIQELFSDIQYSPNKFEYPHHNILVNSYVKLVLHSLRYQSLSDEDLAFIFDKVLAYGIKDYLPKDRDTIALLLFSIFQWNNKAEYFSQLLLSSKKPLEDYYLNYSVIPPIIKNGGLKFIAQILHIQPEEEQQVIYAISDTLSLTDPISGPHFNSKIDRQQYVSFLLQLLSRHESDPDFYQLLLYSANAIEPEIFDYLQAQIKARIVQGADSKTSLTDQELDLLSAFSKYHTHKDILIYERKDLNQKKVKLFRQLIPKLTEQDQLQVALLFQNVYTEYENGIAQSIKELMQTHNLVYKQVLEETNSNIKAKYINALTSSQWKRYVSRESNSTF